MSIRILLADDHKIVRDGLRTLIEKESGMEVIGEAENGRKALKMAQKTHPSLVIMDVTMPDMNGIEATRKIVTEVPGVKVIALSMHSDRRFVLGMLEAGASGYLMKDCAFDELAKAVRSVATGHTYLSPSIADVLVKGYLDKIDEKISVARSPLTQREREILQLLAEGQSSKEIASHLGVSVKTVETHRRNMMQKLNMRSVAELTKYAIREGLISVEG
ncbi:MAG TPA: response regulator transcription factor [Syntrophales bacterium]|nr:response regulator transcription factor [Syntrophales bacterium]HOX93981.1 response regulator transcription factor [Syntrophales bacterium]HPI57038.1 response regulator transcription factor [Syntrophales bacterium]HPN23832.1 response regulator transcription factor [Syntrophales bacterium]HQM30025.1 response regulator transcription factor [Syntrophales bacterium]